MKECCAIEECSQPVICRWHHAQGVTLLCECHLLVWLTGQKPVEQERKPHKRGPYKKP